MVFLKPNSKYKINSNSKVDIELQEIFLDSLAKKKEDEFGVSEKKLEVPLVNRISYVLYGVFVFFAIILIAKTFYLQVIQGETFYFLSENNKVRISLEIPERGVIYDRNLQLLVRNYPAFDLVLDKRDISSSVFEKNGEIEQIALILEKDPGVLKKEIEESEDSRVLIETNLSHQKLVSLETRIKDFPGFYIQKNTTRNYLSDYLFSHLIGYTGKINKEELKNFENYSVTDYIGKEGVEKYYEKILRGQPGKTKIEKDAWGKIKSQSLLSLPEDGKSLVLHLDVKLQEKIEQELKNSLERTGAKKGAVIALDPKTGGVLALVSLPSFNSNLLSQGISFQELESLQQDPLKPFLNRVISGGYVTGSTIKPLISMAALEERIISPELKLYAPLELCLFNRFSLQKECFYDWEFHGWTDMKRAIAESVNPYFYIIGGGYIRPGFADSRLPLDFRGLGQENIKKWLSLFNWGKITGIDLPGEIEGRISKDSSDKNLTIGDTYHLSIGQGSISITPLQVALAFSAIANGGTLYQPQVVQKIVDPSAESEQVQIIEEFKPKIIAENFLLPENLEIVREGMRQAVTSGSSRTLLNLPVKAAAKTGTAQTSNKDYFHHWVTVFAPYENPEIVLTVMIEEVKGLQSATLPIVREVLNWYFSQQRH